MQRLELDEVECADIDLLLDDLVLYSSKLDFDQFVREVPVLAHGLPVRLRSTLNDFRLEHLGGTLTVSGYRVDQQRLGATPEHWGQRSDPSPALREEVLLLLYASLLGDPFGWVTQQDGRLVHNVLPIKGDEYEQIGSSSRSLLTWHTEDAFHPLRSDYLLFACMRNPYDAATTIGCIDDLTLPDDIKSVLFEPRFLIKPDESHYAHNNSSNSGADFSLIDAMRDAPAPVAILFGEPDRPYVRVDPYFMSVADGDDDARQALEYIEKVFDAAMEDVVLADGDFFVIDNYRVVHGRKPFVPRHDGSDRWLKRINVTCDLRKSRQARGSRDARAIN